MVLIRWREVVREYFHRRPEAGIAIVLALALLAVAWLFVRAASVDQRTYYQYATSKAYAQAQEKFSNECVRVATVQEAFNCFSNAIKSARETQRAEEDLYAQKQMADWTASMFWATVFIGIVSVTIAVVSVVLIRRTLEAQRSATDAASKAVDAATEANRLSREAMIVEQRPWLAVKASIAGPIKWANGDCRITTYFTIKNLGSTPALGVDLKLKMVPLLYNGLAEDQYKMAKMDRPPRSRLGRVIFPGDTHETYYSLSITQKEIESAMKPWGEDAVNDPWVSP